MSKTNPISVSKKTTKSDLIRSLPKLSAKEVVEYARRGGVNISQAMVYTVRGRPIPTRGRGRPRKHFNTTPPTGSKFVSAEEIEREIAQLEGHAQMLRGLLTFFPGYSKASAYLTHFPNRR